MKFGKICLVEKCVCGRLNGEEEIFKVEQPNFGCGFFWVCVCQVFFLFEMVNSYRSSVTCWVFPRWSFNFFVNGESCNVTERRCRVLWWRGSCPLFFWRRLVWLGLRGEGVATSSSVQGVEIHGLSPLHLLVEDASYFFQYIVESETVNWLQKCLVDSHVRHVNIWRLCNNSLVVFLCFFVSIFFFLSPSTRSPSLICPPFLSKNEMLDKIYRYGLWYKTNFHGRPSFF